MINDSSEDQIKATISKPASSFPSQILMPIRRGKTYKVTRNKPNTLRFKPQALQNTDMKYDCIYKNLFRDIRRFFSNDFNETTSYSKDKYTK
jgi:hypothetical protein